jgi:hypothetical protein
MVIIRVLTENGGLPLSGEKDELLFGVVDDLPSTRDLNQRPTTGEGNVSVKPSLTLCYPYGWTASALLGRRGQG